MNENILLIIICSGFVLLALGFGWSIVAARPFHWSWQLFLFLCFMVALPVFAYKHWDKAKKPFIVSLVGFALLIISSFLIPPS